MSWLDDFTGASNPAQQEPMLGNGWAKGLALLGAAIRDMSDARQGKSGNALLGVQQMIRQDQAIGRKQAEEADQKSAQAALLGGLDPTSGITWNQPRQGTSEADQKALFMRAFPEAGAKAAAASLFPKPSPWEDIPLTGGAAQPAAGAPPLLGSQQPPATAPLLGAGSGGTTTQPRAPISATPIDATGAPLGVRNNNPGNIRVSDIPWNGKAPGGEGGFERFNTPEDGVSALTQNLLTYQDKHGLNTIEGIINRWAPASDNNNVGAYVASVAQRTGLDPKAALNLRDPNVMKPLVSAIIQHENGQQPYDPAVIERAVAARLQPDGGRVQVAQANTGTMTDAGPAVTMPAPQASALPAPAAPQAAPPAPAAQPGRTPTVGVRRNRETGDVQYYDPTTRMPLPAPPTGYRYTPYGMEMDPAYLEAEMKLRAASRPQNNVTVGGEGSFQKELGQGVAKDLIARREVAASAVDQLAALGEAQKLLDGGIISGAGANWKLAFDKAVSGIGLSDGSRAANTEAFVSTIGRQTLGLVKALGSGSGISNADREFAEKIAGGNIELNEASIRKIVDISNRAANTAITRYNASIQPFLADSATPGSIRAYLPIDPGAPPMRSAPADDARSAASANPAQAPQAPTRADIEAELRRRGKLP